DAEHRPAIAVTPPGDTASLAGAAADGDFARDAPSDPAGIRARRFFDDADELVSGDAGEPGVAARQFQIGPADAGREHADQAFGGGRGLRAVSYRQRTGGIENDGARRGDQCRGSAGGSSASGMPRNPAIARSFAFTMRTLRG